MNSIISQINSLYIECTNNKNNDQIGFDLKKNLWEIKHTVDSLIRRAPCFDEELLYLDRQEKKKIIKNLKG